MPAGEFGAMGHDLATTADCGLRHLLRLTHPISTAKLRGIVVHNLCNDLVGVKPSTVRGVSLRDIDRLVKFSERLNWMGSRDDPARGAPLLPRVRIRTPLRQAVRL